jgi:hypothetical protein
MAHGEQHSHRGDWASDTSQLPNGSKLPGYATNDREVVAAVGTSRLSLPKIRMSNSGRLHGAQGSPVRPFEKQTIKGEGSMFLVQAQSRAQAAAFTDWREAADLVATRWGAFVRAEPWARGFAFGAYVAALDAEEAAAADLASLASSAAAV